MDNRDKMINVVKRIVSLITEFSEDERETLRDYTLQLQLGLGDVFDRLYIDLQPKEGTSFGMEYTIKNK